MDGAPPPKSSKRAERDAVIVPNNVCRGLATDELISPRNVFAKGKKRLFQLAVKLKLKQMRSNDSLALCWDLRRKPPLTFMLLTFEHKSPEWS